MNSSYSHDFTMPLIAVVGYRSIISDMKRWRTTQTNLSLMFQLNLFYKSPWALGMNMIKDQGVSSLPPKKRRASLFQASSVILVSITLQFSLWTRWDRYRTSLSSPTRAWAQKERQRRRRGRWKWWMGCKQGENGMGDPGKGGGESQSSRRGGDKRRRRSQAESRMQ